MVFRVGNIMRYVSFWLAASPYLRPLQIFPSLCPYHQPLARIGLTHVYIVVYAYRIPRHRAICPYRQLRRVSDPMP